MWDTLLSTGHTMMTKSSMALALLELIVQGGHIVVIK